MFIHSLSRNPEEMFDFWFLMHKEPTQFDPLFSDPFCRFDFRCRLSLHESNRICIMCECVLICFSLTLYVRLSVWLSATLWTVSHQVHLSMGFSRQEYCSGLPFPLPGDLPSPGMEPESLTSPALAGRFFTSSPPKEAQNWHQWPHIDLHTRIHWGAKYYKCQHSSLESHSLIGLQWGSDIKKLKKVSLHSTWF